MRESLKNLGITEHIIERFQCSGHDELKTEDWEANKEATYASVTLHVQDGCHWIAQIEREHDDSHWNVTLRGEDEHCCREETVDKAMSALAELLYAEI